MHLSSHMAAIVGPRAQKELFHEHEKPLVAKGRSDFLQLSKKQLPCWFKVSRVHFGSKLVKWHSMTSDMHGQVTHAFIFRFIPQGALSRILPLMLEGSFSFPTRSFFVVSLQEHNESMFLGWLNCMHALWHFCIGNLLWLLDGLWCLLTIGRLSMCCWRAHFRSSNGGIYFFCLRIRMKTIWCCGLLGSPLHRMWPIIQAEAAHEFVHWQLM